MADNADTVSSLREELNKLAAQMEKMVKNLEHKKDAESEDLTSRIAREVSRYRNMADTEARKLFSAGQERFDEVGAHVRANPMTSLLIAFGAGCVISCLLRHLR